MNTTELAQAIVSAWQQRRQIDPVSRTNAAFGLPEAYEVQTGVIAGLTASGWQAAGAKVGLSDPAALAALGLKEPVSGMLFDTMWRASGTVIARQDFNMPRVEGELCFTLAHDLTDPELTLSDTTLAIASVAPAIEIVDSRWQDWNSTVPDLVAENVAASLCVLGEPLTGIDPATLEARTMTMEIDGKPVAAGAALAVYGSPIRSLHWLAGSLARRGRPLRAGHRIMSGAFARMIPTGAGQTVAVDFPGIGQVSVAFEGRRDAV